jgi:D-glycero-D-manno-heptose 1,7-bisphosphate phosphatase
MNTKALFLDRDGVINIDKGYVHRPDQIEFVEGIFELCRAAQERGLLLVVITNQAGVARGLYTEEDVHALHGWLAEQFVQHALRIERFYYCPYHPEHGIGRYKRDSDMRKPNPGMIVQARDDFEIDLKSSVLIGDKDSDIAAGLAAGVGTNILVTDRPHVGALVPAALAFHCIKDVAAWLAASAPSS